MRIEVQLSSFIDEISMGPFGSDIKVENFVDDGVPVLNGANLLGYKLNDNSFNYVTLEKAKTFRKAIAKRGDIIITHRGTLGQICYVPENSKFEQYVISQSQFRVKFNEAQIDPRYIVYLFHTPYGQKKLLSFKSHVGVPALAQATTNFRALNILIHKLSDQKKIANVITAIEDKIELNNRINAELEHMAKTIYDYWFVQFDFPISAEYAASVGQPELAGKPYKSSGGKMVWSDELKREVPEGWEVRIISEFGRFVNGKGIEKTKFSKDGIYPVYGSNGVTGYSNEILFDEPVIAVGRVGANYGEVHYSLEPCWVSDNAVTAQPVKSFYLWWLIETLKKIDYRKIAGGSAQPLITQGQLKELKFIVPQDDIFIVYNDKVKKNYELLNLNLKENQKLTELRDWLLPMLMNGQVKVGDMVDEGVMGMAAEAVEEYIVRGE